MSIVFAGVGGNFVDTISFLDITEEESHNVILLDDNKTGEFCGMKIISTIDDFISKRAMINYNQQFVIYNTIGSAGDNRARNKVFYKFRDAGYTVQPLVYPCDIAFNVKHGENVFVNLGCAIHHDCIIGHNTVLAPRVLLCGNVTIGNNCFLGASTTVIQGIKIGDNVITGAGSVVVNNISNNEIVVGVPASFLKYNEFV